MPVAIRGAGLRCALGADAEACVDRLLEGGVIPGRIALEDLAEPVEVSYFRIADGVPLFDAGRFERLLPPVVQAALAGSGLTAAERRELPVYLGSSCFSIGLAESRYRAALAQGAADALPMPHCGYGYLVDLVLGAVGSAGQVLIYNTACTASANALLGAARALTLGRHAHALVVGAELANLTTLSGFSGLQLLTDRVRPFAAERNGIVLGEGIGAVLLSAQPRDGEYLLHGGANNCDGFSITTADPGGGSVAAAIKQAMLVTGTETVRAVRAHGTATSTGDMAEAAGLRKVFSEVPALTVLKPHLGHTLGACGVNELVLYLGALRRGVLPGAETGSPDRELGVQALSRQAKAASGRYLLNHFGFGGSNTVLVLEKP